MTRSNFRIKVDLSNFYDDMRRSSWIYVDNENISCICHLEKHIAKIFDIRRPFCLLLNTGEYLPPNEDARILKENDIILVVPGPAFRNDTVPANSKPIPEAATDTSLIISRSQPKERVSPEIKTKLDTSESEDNAYNTMEATTDNTVFLSMIDDSLMETTSESQMEVNSCRDSSTLGISPTKNKRKRTRTKRSKKTASSDQIPSVTLVAESEPKKPKILNSITIPNRKHIRFDESEKNHFYRSENSVSNDSKTIETKSVKNGREDSSWDKIGMNQSNLSNLLALRQCSTPTTFVRKKPSEMCQAQISNLEAVENTIKDCQITERNNHTLSVDPKKHPLMEKRAQINDVIAFKMLTLSSDYTPGVSEYVVAQVLEVTPERSSYVFKIIDGKDKIQAPQGKFDIESEEPEDKKMDVITLSWSQLIEPRLIYRA